MGKTMLIVMVLMFVNGCGSKDNEPNLKAKKNKDSELNLKAKKNSELNKTIEVVDFVPEHVRNSTIEVVPH